MDCACHSHLVSPWKYSFRHSGNYQYAIADWGGVSFRLVDTGGLDDDIPCAKEVKSQIELALSEASVAIVVVDGQDGILTHDHDVCDLVFKAKSKKKDLKIILCVNKLESWRVGPVLAEQFWQLGLGKPFPISALHGIGIGDLMDECIKGFESGLVPPEDPDIVISFVGRPNSGKSSLVNALSKSERCLTSATQGTTVDTVQVPIESDGKKILLIDTAGMRLVTSSRCAYLPQNRSKRAIRKSDVCVLVLDATWGISKNDFAIAEEIKNEFKAAVIVCNKWDLLDKDATLYKNAVGYLQEKLPALGFADIVFSSAKTGKRVNVILEAAKNAHLQYSRTFSTALLNELLREATFMQKPPTTHGKRLTLYYCCQVHTRPPGIALFCNDDLLLTKDYLRYLQLFFTRSLKLWGSPIKYF
ncbi:bifunctional GTP binding domain/P-loop containing nucleoside triphosphate hydrolase/GTP-binding protein EngA/GTPase Der [Babesia duncani]|uniref:GTPase Der n=1 Tax=Babesia duncani TaxID=323732 RepID=A0AAD9UNJ4_9APIC|nr:bifunctional GTP binding domain/P-loop containing nucleoside triphosphate hydrolase/GTP-binding protein EngA/GTPase Der [Babesia duncani]